jgi:YidC/Oxa1 family membrane protein insertase
MTDQKNVFLAIMLSTLVLIVWQGFFAPPPIEPTVQEDSLTPKAPQSTQAIAETATPVDRDKAITKNTRIAINNQKLKGSLSLNGLRFDDLTLTDYQQSTEEDSKAVILLSPKKTQHVYFSEFGWISSDETIAVPNANTVWKSSGNDLTPSSPLTLTWNNQQGLVFKAIISIDEDYLFTIKQEVVNNSGKQVTLFPYGLISREKQLSGDSYAILHEGPLGVFDQILNETRYESLKEDKTVSFNNVQGWLGITDKYWLTAIIPGQDASFNSNYKYFYKNGQDRYQTDYIGQAIEIAPGNTADNTQYFFAGAKQINLLDRYAEEKNIALFDRAVDFGWLYFITKPIFKALTFLNSLFGNFGLAILGLTVIIKLFLFPLANKSYIATHHLKRLQPKMVELRDRHKDNRVELNQHMMKLYKEEKVNPLSGCLPILVQIPIFFALYKVLFVTIEMRHAPFYGWIDDLSAIDPTSIFNLFGLLPWDAPSFLAIGAWPIIMGVTMIIQQKLNPTPTDPVQAKVMKYLPYIFIFIFATFPAGLIIYWAWNNVLSILQQWIITRRLPR